jgi:MoxR-like ATPase
MSRRPLDSSVRLTREMFAKQPEVKEIESTDVPEIAAEEPRRKSVSREPYVVSDALIEAVNMAAALGRPLLLQGDPGCGKTRLAHAVAYVLGLPLEEAYIKSTSRAQDLLYTFDAVRQLYDVQTGDKRDRRAYIRFGPLGHALVRAQYGRRSVVLLDEIDKADIDFPKDLLWELDRLEFRVAEVEGMRYAVHQPALRPIVLITHNEEKPLPPAFLRRCIFFHIAFPSDPGFLRQLLAAHGLDGRNEVPERAIEVLLNLRNLELTKRPGLSELLDWVGYLEAVKTPVDELATLPHVGLLLKQHVDQQRASKELGSRAVASEDDD